MCQTKTFFPSSWSKEKVIHVILEANQNRIKDVTLPFSPYKTFLCQSSNNIFIEIIVDLKNTIISAYPSKDNFRN